MFKKIGLVFDFISNMGWRYVFFRLGYVLQTKAGLLKRRFPITFKAIQAPELDRWRESPPPFFLYGKEIHGLERIPSPILKEHYEEITSGIFTFFGHLKYQVDGWHVNPDSGFRYNAKKHWTEIPDLSKKTGDIKFVWEKARFAFIYDIIRYDYHWDQDCSVFVFNQIESFIEENPVNLGPQYKCSQEISLRVMNWTFALYYYKDSVYLTDRLFKKIMQSIYVQLHHVYHNINFSRISVRNNHAITETLMLYLSGLLFPFLPGVEYWSQNGKRWLEQEIAYQIYEDGTFLQFSMNYHRVVVQLLTWALRLSDLNGRQVAPIVRDRAAKSLAFLDACTDPVSGRLPNYGANDGALFFKLTDDDYRVYTSQLNDLRMLLRGEVSRVEESIHWYGFKDVRIVTPVIQGAYAFEKGGYYILQEGNVKTFIRCGRYKDRPSQSDNLHLDIWAEGENFLWDVGTYKYNTDDEHLRYFKGVEGHNTVSVSNHDQMLKGKRFIWFYWIKEAKAKWRETPGNQFVFEGEMKGFRQLGGAGYKHKRKVVKRKEELRWTVYDKIDHGSREELQQHWHINPELEDRINIYSFDENDRPIKCFREEKWYSGYYGVKEKSVRFTFKTKSNLIKTEILIQSSLKISTVN